MQVDRAPASNLGYMRAVKYLESRATNTRDRSSLQVGTRTAQFCFQRNGKRGVSSLYFVCTANQPWEPSKKHRQDSYDERRRLCTGRAMRVRCVFESL